jgi:hypothetical protein
MVKVVNAEGTGSDGSNAIPLSALICHEIFKTVEDIFFHFALIKVRKRLSRFVDQRIE